MADRQVGRAVYIIRPQKRFDRNKEEICIQNPEEKNDG